MHRGSRDHIFIGGVQIFNLPELVHYFGDYETLSLSVKSNKLWIYLNGILVKSLDFISYNSVGKVKRIDIGFKGCGSVDCVKLYERKTSVLRKILMLLANQVSYGINRSLHCSIRDS